MPDDPKTTDAALMEPAPQGHTMPTEPTAAPARPQSQAPAASPQQAPAVAVAQRPSTAPASLAAPAAQPAPAPAPRLVTLNYNGKEYQVTPDVAEVWAQRQSAFDSGYKKTLEELKRYKDTIESVSRPAEPTEEEKREQLATRLLTEPDKVIAEIRADLKKELTQLYQGDISAREFQANWWGRNSEILPYREMFDGLMLLNAKKYIDDGLSDAQAYDRNAESVRKMILSIKGNGAANVSQAAQHTEEPAPSSGATVVREPAVETGFTSMSDTMRARRQRRLEASLQTARPTSAA